MKKDPKFFLQHILDSIAEIEKNLKGTSEAEFKKSVPKQDAVIRRLEIIGEAAKNIPGGIRLQYKFVPWKKIAGARDVLIHNYFEVDLKTVWNAATKDIIQLKQDVREILREM